MPPPPGMSPAGVMDSMAAQFGLINSLRTGNMILDMLICMVIPIVFGTIGSALQSASPTLRHMVAKFQQRNVVIREVTHEKRTNMYGWSLPSATSDHMLQKAIMLYLAKSVLKDRAQRQGSLTLTEVPKKDQVKDGGERERESDNNSYYYDSDDDERAGGQASLLRTMEVSTMPPEDEWIEVGDGVEVMRRLESDNDGSEKAPIKTEKAIVQLRAKGRYGDASARIGSFVKKAFEWYRATLEKHLCRPIIQNHHRKSSSKIIIQHHHSKYFLLVSYTS